MPANSVIQDWVFELPKMQQTVLMAATRGPDGFQKYHPVKPILRWFRRCTHKDAVTGGVLSLPYGGGGGSFAGPIVAGPCVGLPVVHRQGRDPQQQRSIDLLFRVGRLTNEQ